MKIFIKPVLLISALIASVFSLSLNAQTLAQEPLLSKTISVRPNLTFILDDSGSMDLDCIYTQNTKASFPAGNLMATRVVMFQIYVIPRLKIIP